MPFVADLWESMFQKRQVSTVPFCVGVQEYPILWEGPPTSWDTAEWKSSEKDSSPTPKPTGPSLSIEVWGGVMCRKGPDGVVN